MSKFKCRRNDECRSTKGRNNIETRETIWSFVLRHSFVICISTFVILT